MNITDNHLLDEATKVLLSPDGGQMNTRRVLVIHFTSGASARSSIDYWKKLANGVCAHLTIDRDGTVFQCRAFNRTAGHAGVSRWVDRKTGSRYGTANAYAIGIELANAGNDPGALAWARRQATYAGTLRAAHRNGGPVQEWENYPTAQLHACEAIAQLLVTRYALDDITGHDCIAPERKDDPGPAFPMQRLREACGFKGLPEVFRP